MSEPFTTVFFDLDHTLFDFEASKRAAFEEALLASNVTQWEALLPVLGRIEGPLWQALEAGSATLDTLNDDRFAGLVNETDLDVDPAVLSAAYLDGLGRNGGLLPGGRALLDQLVETHSLALLSNGYSSVQRARLINFDLDRYFSTVVISDEVGVAKPSGRFFDIALENAGRPSLDTVLMVGDNLVSDISGATRAGLATCWYNPDGRPAPGSGEATFEVAHLSEIAALVY